MLIKNGRIHDGLGNVFEKDLRMEDGLIKELGQLEAKPGEEVFDAAGMEVMPGFIQPISAWGVNGTMAEIRPSSDDNDEKTNPILPELDAFYAFNGRAATYQQLSAFGLTVCGVAATDKNVFSGTIAAFEVDGVNPYKMCLKRDIGMMSSVTKSVKMTYGGKQAAPMTKMWIFTQFADQLKKAADYEEAADKPKDAKLAALKRVVKGELPLFTACDSLQDANFVYEIVKAYPELKLVIVNGAGLTGDEDWIVENNIPIVVRQGNGMNNSEQVCWKAIAKFAEKGALIALSGGAGGLFAISE